jgi:D-alanyl-D-alanine dipeptidase
VIPIKSIRLLWLLAALLSLGPLHPTARSSQALGTTNEQLPKLSTRPRPAPQRWRRLLGEYASAGDTLIVLEQDGQLALLLNRTDLMRLQEVGNSFRVVSNSAGNSARAGQAVMFKRDIRGRVTGVIVNNAEFARRQVGPEAGVAQLRVSPVRPVPDLLKEARIAAPPQESGAFRISDLVELTKLDPTIRLDIRYATTNNLFGTVFYSQPRAFLQRPAAEAVVRVNRKLRELGYVLLIHDAYRPWYVTKVFWDATPDDKKIFVADPSKGSRHNRGAAVDLTLFDLRTRKVVEMVSTYDETTDRAYPNYPGGTALQRWSRDLLRTAMENEGFSVYEAEWWHFDYRDWQQYPIGNQPFEQLHGPVSQIRKILLKPVPPGRNPDTKMRRLV